MSPMSSRRRRVLIKRLALLTIGLVVVAGAAWLVIDALKPTAAEHVARGDGFVEAGQLPEASIEYRNALQLDPNLGDVRLKLGDIFVQQNNPSGALREYVRAADLLPDNFDAQVKAGNLLLLAGQFQDARARANRAVALDATSPQAQVLLGNTLAGLRDVEGAIANYQQALVLNPGEEVAYRNIATLQASSGQLAEAEASFRKALEVAPTSVEPRMALASFLWANNRASEAEEVLKASLELDPNNVLALRALGTFYIGSNRIAEAEQYFAAIDRSEKTTASSIALADYYILAERFDEARGLLRTAASDESAYADATLRLAAIDASLGQRAQAQEKLRELLGRHPRNMAARLLNARLLALDGRREEALAQAVSIATDDPQSPVAADAQLLAGTLQAGLDRPEDAIRSFEEVLRRRPRTTAAELGLARVHLSRGAADRAEMYVKDALSTDADNPAARAEMVRVLLAQGRTADAAQQLAGLQAEYPNATPVLNLLAVQQVAQQQFAAARATYTRLLSADPSDVEAIAGLVRLEMATGRAQEALARVNDALKVVEPSAPLYVLAAEVYLATGDTTKAEEVLLQAIELEPARLQAYGTLGLLYARQSRLDEAAQHFTELTTRNPSSVPAGTMLGMIREAQRDLTAAETEYRRVLALDPQAPVAANNLAWLYVASNRNVAEALDLAQTALRGLPGHPDVNDTLGWIYYKQGDYRRAIEHLEAAVAKAPKAAMTHYHLGLAYLGFGERDRARETLQFSLSLGTPFDGIDDAKRTLAELGD